MQGRCCDRSIFQGKPVCVERTGTDSIGARDLSLASMQTFLSWVISFWAVLLKKVPEN